MPNVTCVECGKAFHAPHCEVEKRKYCGMGCRRSAQAVKKTCPGCGRTFSTPRSHASQVCCSAACRKTLPHALVVMECDRCGKSFQRKQSQIKFAKRHYCSTECASLGNRNRMIVYCEVCGKAVERIKGWQNKRHFCSSQCFGTTVLKGEDNPFWNGGRKERHNCGAWKKAVKDRAGRKCERCGSEKKLHAHHIMSYRQRPDLITDLDNGICLCAKCHMKTHSRQKLAVQVVMRFAS